MEKKYVTVGEHHHCHYYKTKAFLAHKIDVLNREFIVLDILRVVVW